MNFDLNLVPRLSCPQLSSLVVGKVGEVLYKQWNLVGMRAWGMRLDQFSWWWCVHHTFYRKLRKRDVSKFHIQLCIALLCMLVVFVSGIDQTQIYEGCVTVSALLHYFTLVMWMWMGAEAVLMFQKLVIVFGQTTTRYIIAVSLVCWRKFPGS